MRHPSHCHAKDYNDLPLDTINRKFNKVRTTCGCQSPGGSSGGGRRCVRSRQPLAKSRLVRGRGWRDVGLLSARPCGRALRPCCAIGFGDRRPHPRRSHWARWLLQWSRLVRNATAMAPGTGRGHWRSHFTRCESRRLSATGIGETDRTAQATVLGSAWPRSEETSLALSPR